MSRGFNQHQARLEAVKGLGRALARRARSKCELCESSGVRLDPYEVPPIPEDPVVDRAVMLCERCGAGLGGGPIDALSWRFLESVVWTEVAPVQVTAVRLLRRAAEEGVSWAVEALEGLYLEPEIEAWVEGSAPDEA